MGISLVTWRPATPGTRRVSPFGRCCICDVVLRVGRRRIEDGTSARVSSEFRAASGTGEAVSRPCGTASAHPLDESCISRYVLRYQRADGARFSFWGLSSQSPNSPEPLQRVDLGPRQT